MENPGMRYGVLKLSLQITAKGPIYIPKAAVDAIIPLASEPGCNILLQSGVLYSVLENAEDILKGRYDVRINRSESSLNPQE